MSELLPDDDAAAPADPFEAELVAYLDGELEPAAARRVEARLASDPQARARAAALKKTFDLLDYLPRPEPSTTFTTRTLDRLPALQAAAEKSQTQSGTSPAAAKTARPSQSAVPVLAPLSSSGVNGSSSILSLDEARPRRWLWAVGFVLAVAGFAVSGYYGANAVRRQATPRPVVNRPTTTSGPADELSLSDRRLIENLPLYAFVDDAAFANELAKPDLFGEDPNVSYDASLKVPAVQPEPLSNQTLASMEKAFKQLPPERQQAIRDLDKQLYAEPAPIRDRLLRVLEAYALWLNGLSEGERRGVLAADTPDVRLRVIQELRDKQYIERLSPSQRSQLEVASGEDLKKALLKGWKSGEGQKWAAALKRPAELFDPTKAPWPFDSDSRRKEIEAFAQSAFQLDSPKGSRLTANEVERYVTAHSFATQQGGAAWGSYGKVVYELAKKYEDLQLPPPASPRLRFTDTAELPVPYQNLVKKNTALANALTPVAGKWPEYPLKLHEWLFFKGYLTKVDAKQAPPLGPCRKDELTTSLQKFLETELQPKLTEADRGRLARDEGKWPDYPREIVRLARQHDVSVPDVMLPGSPSRWDAIYGAKAK
jgi:hypothetical protein